MPRRLPLTIAIPTFRRERVLIDTLAALAALDPCADETLVLDQTPSHEDATRAALERLEREGRIRWLRLAEPSVPKAMNRALVEARHPAVLFLDDDIVPLPGLVAAHASADRAGPRLIAGRVLQPWDADAPSASWASLRFASTEGCDVDRFMGGNFSVARERALALGGFDENFVRVAYEFEREFADRWRAAGGTIRFVPDAAIRHLKASSGGTRSYGEHLTTAMPAHSVGAYYYLLRSPLAEHRIRAFLSRLVRSILTRHHLRRPWWIPVTLVAELAGMAWALTLRPRGPRYAAGAAAPSPSPRPSPRVRREAARRAGEGPPG